MAENESPELANVKPDSAAPAGAPRRLSGLLIFSIFLTMGSFLVNQLFLIGPVGGIILALLGRRAAKKDPNVTGPRFAVVALLIAVIAFGFESYLLYRAWPAIKAWEQIRQGPVGTLEKVKERKFDEIHALFVPAYQERVSAEELSKAFAEVFPGEGEIALETATEIKDELYTDDFRRRLEEFSERIRARPPSSTPSASSTRACSSRCAFGFTSRGSIARSSRPR